MSKNQKFYDSKVWKNQRKYIWMKQNCLCALCKAPVWINGISDSSIPKSSRLRGIVHHKEFLDDLNVKDDTISLNEDNLIGLCVICHQQVHSSSKYIRSDLRFDENGNVVKNELYEHPKFSSNNPPTISQVKK